MLPTLHTSPESNQSQVSSVMTHSVPNPKSCLWVCTPACALLSHFISSRLSQSDGEVKGGWGVLKSAPWAFLTPPSFGVDSARGWCFVCLCRKLNRGFSTRLLYILWTEGSFDIVSATLAFLCQGEPLWIWSAQIIPTHALGSNEDVLAGTLYRHAAF